MRVLFFTNLPSPYRVNFFNELGKYCELTVCYERKKASDRDEKWKGEEVKSFKEVYLNLIPVGTDRSKGNALKNFIKNAEFDILILTNYISPAVMQGILCCRAHKIPYLLEYDGGFYKKDNFVKGILKKFLLKGAKYHLTTCEEHIKYLKSIGIKEEKIFKYPFTSLTEQDVLSVCVNEEEKRGLKEKLNITEEKTALFVGQFIYRKGIDVLLKAAKEVEGVGFYLIGGEPTEEYVHLKNSLGLTNVHFLSFKTKDELKEYYKIADLLAFPTREDIWGLVVNEAMAYGLPVITTQNCIAGLELIENEKNGYIIPVDDEKLLAEKINKIVNDNVFSQRIKQNNMEKIKSYTIEKMAIRHMEIFEEIRNG